VADDTGAYALFANVVQPDSSLRLGAKVRIRSVPGEPANIEVRGMSRGGRMVTKWIRSNRLGNFRASWVPSSLGRWEGSTWPTRDEADAYRISRGLMNDRG
jgi:hypothetical protein